MARRKGRGRLNSIDRLPEDADDAVRWAMAALAQRDIPQTDILEEFNRQLAGLDPPCGPISRSAFGRHSLRFAQQARRLQEAREAATALAERLDDMPEGDIGLMVGETIKALVNDVILDKIFDGDSPSITMLRDAAETVQRLELARKANVDTGLKAREAVMRKAVKAIEDGVSQGQIDAAAAAKAREIMGFA